MKERKQIHWNPLQDVDPEDLRAEPIQNPIFKTNTKRQENDYRQKGQQCNLTLEKAMQNATLCYSQYANAHQSTDWRDAFSLHDRFEFGLVERQQTSQRKCQNRVVPS